MKTYTLKVNGNAYEVAINGIDGTKVSVDVNGKAYDVELEAPAKPAAPVIARPAAPAPAIAASLTAAMVPFAIP